MTMTRTFINKEIHSGNMENKTAEKYYQHLAATYDREVRAWIPQHTDMIDTIASLVRLGEPRIMLDIGPGTGYIDERILRENPEAKLDLVEASDAMFQIAGKRMYSYDERTRLFLTDVKDYEPDRRYNLVLSNLVLHNIGDASETKESRDQKKIDLLQRIHSWLNPGGVFVWGDLIKYDNPALMDFFYDYRTTLAIERGTDPEFVPENIDKERNKDNPWTIEETIEKARNAGFSSVHPVWTHDTFGIFYLRK